MSSEAPDGFGDDSSVLLPATPTLDEWSVLDSNDGLGGLESPIGLGVPATNIGLPSTIDTSAEVTPINALEQSTLATTVPAPTPLEEGANPASLLAGNPSDPERLVLSFLQDVMDIPSLIAGAAPASSDGNAAFDALRSRGFGGGGDQPLLKGVTPLAETSGQRTLQTLSGGDGDGLGPSAPTNVLGGQYTPAPATKSTSEPDEAPGDDEAQPSSPDPDKGPPVDQQGLPPSPDPDNKLPRPGDYPDDPPAPAPKDVTGLPDGSFYWGRDQTDFGPRVYYVSPDGHFWRGLLTTPVTGVVAAPVAPLDLSWIRRPAAPFVIYGPDAADAGWTDTNQAPSIDLTQRLLKQIAAADLPTGEDPYAPDEDIYEPDYDPLAAPAGAGGGGAGGASPGAPGGMGGAPPGAAGGMGGASGALGNPGGEADLSGGSGSTPTGQGPHIPTETENNLMLGAYLAIALAVVGSAAVATAGFQAAMKALQPFLKVLFAGKAAYSLSQVKSSDDPTAGAATLEGLLALSMFGTKLPGFGPSAAEDLAGMGAAGRRGGRILSPDEVAYFRALLEQHGVELEVGSERLPVGLAGAFRTGGTGRPAVLLLSDPTAYEMIHESMHMRQWLEYGPAGYANVSEAMKEVYVWRQLETQYWELLTPAEQLHAEQYMWQHLGLPGGPK